METSGSMIDGDGGMGDAFAMIRAEHPIIPMWSDWGHQISASIKRRWGSNGNLYADFKCGCGVMGRTSDKLIWHKRCRAHK